MSNTLDPIGKDVPAPAVPQRPRYALRIVPGGYVGGVLGKHSFMFVTDLDSAKHWESPEAAREWLAELPAGHAARLVDRSLFVVQFRLVPGRIVASWKLVIPIAEPEPEGAKT